MKNINLKTADRVATERDANRTCTWKDSTELQCFLYRILFPLFHPQIQVTAIEVILHRQTYSFQ